MNQQPLFSLITPSYNTVKYVQEMIDSVFAQTYINWELIIIDDCSTDDSWQYLQQYANHPQISIYQNDRNRGVGHSYHRASYLAKGEIIGILDPDDSLATNDALEIMVKHHLHYKDSGIICSRHYAFNEWQGILWESAPRDKDENLSYLTDRENHAEHFITFKREPYRLVGGINPTYRNAPDQDLYFRMEEVSKITFVDDILYNYRITSGGLTRNSYKNMYWHVNSIIISCQRRGIDPEPVVDKLIKQLMQPRIDQYNRLLNSRYYKVGYKVLTPIYKTKDFLSRIFKPKRGI
ncbi:glycosyltransferase involved in cell wall biosynthesis [Dysgonomonas sp. PH5-45]|uniref:glycosyltransferase family 2 protein n=1 Tax=unclassified Dysgonomonas TaxID=2630389 RepID=UPI00247573AD|nr:MULTISPECIES: glycosyltransferase [unclassified Dysgonomonas]MDH6353709.1 glycosyltransferase involved in cell wall biosynthesis [Dysgonomonas sp. PH5-45]MDH6386612.1 glycosyltransferase involved in cell wall biosynthesis [Dysgonomonas sp. PH5-37]